MGQAKQRGSFEQRQAAAIEKKEQERKQRPQTPCRYADPQTVALMAVMTGLNNFATTPEEDK